MLQKVFIYSLKQQLRAVLEEEEELEEEEGKNEEEVEGEDEKEEQELRAALALLKGRQLCDSRPRRRRAEANGGVRMRSCKS